MARLPKAVTALPFGRVAIVGHGVVVCHRVVVAIFSAEDSNSGNFVTFVEAHHDHTPRTRPVAVDAFDVCAHYLTALADQEQLLVVLVDQLDGRDAPRLVALDGNERHALATAVLASELRCGHSLAVTGFGQKQDVVAGLDDAHADDLVGLVREPDADHARGVAAHWPDLTLAETPDLAQRRGEDDVVIAGRHRGPRELVVLGDRDRSYARRADALELLDRRLLDDPLAGGHDHVRTLLEVRNGDDGQDELPWLELDSLQVDDRDALARPLSRRRDRVHLGAEDAAAVGEEERPIVRAGNEQVLDSILLDRLRADDALAAADLAAISGQWLALDVAARRDRDDDVLVRDQVLVGQLTVRIALDSCQSDAGVLRRELAQLVLDDREDTRRVRKDVLELGDELDRGEVLVLDLLALERCQTAQLHLEDGVGLNLTQLEARAQVATLRI